MGITHHDSVTVAGALVVTGTATLSGVVSSNSPTTLAVAGTAVVSGIFTATGAGKQSSLTKLAVSGTAVVSGVFTASAANKQSTLTKLNVTGTTRVSGPFSATASSKTSSVGILNVTAKSTLAQLVVSSAANAWCGKKSFSHASLATTALTVITSKVRSDSRIFLTEQPSAGMAISQRMRAKALVDSITGSTGFGVRFVVVGGAQPTGATGTVHWNIVNIS